MSSHNEKDLFKSAIENRLLIHSIIIHLKASVIEVGKGAFGEVKKAYLNPLGGNISTATEKSSKDTVSNALSDQTSLNLSKGKSEDEGYYLAFHRFIEVMKNIKQFIGNVSTLSGFQKYFHANSVKEKFESLTSDFESVMNDLHFTTATLCNDEQRRIDQENLISDLEEMAKSHKPNTIPITANEIDPKDLKDPQVRTVIRKMLNNEETKNILKFYGLSKVGNQNVMVFEWADFGSLQEVYKKYDISWRSKVQMALDICRGLVFLQTCDIIHHDFRCANIMMTKQLVPKLSNFKYARHNSQATTDIKEITNILRWMAPEKMLDPKKVRYTFKCEIFSFGMLLWELLFQKIPYEDKDMNEIKDHVLRGGRENITMHFSSQETQTIQNKFFKIIIAAWQQDIDIRASLMQIFLKLQKLAANYPMDTSPTLNPLGSLYGSQVIESISIRTSTTELPDSFQNFTLPTIVPLEEGIEAHKNKDYKKAWSCFEENVKFNNIVAKYWMGYYLSKGLLGKKDLVKANLLFKEAADDGVADAQLHYAFSLFNTPGIKFDRQIFVSYLTKAANGGNVAAQYNLGDIYFNGKILDKEKHNISQDEKDSNISNSESAKNALGVLGVVGDAVQPYLPLFSTVTIIIVEINTIYANAKYNKKICNSLMDRFIEVMKNIKQFIGNVSTLSGFQKYFHANSVKEKFESLTSDFESAMSELHFTTTLRNDDQRRIDQESLVNTVLTEIRIIKNQLTSPKPNTTPITANEIDPKELKNPYVGRPDDRRGNTVIRKMLSNGEDVACKTKIIDAEGQKIKAHLAILGKLKESKNILKFYGLSKVEDQNVMVFEWADFGSLQEVYSKYDIGWRSKVQMALDICRGLVFLQTCEILHHDIRCANIMMTKQLVPKLSNFKYARHNSQATTDIKEITNILRWMAPEKMPDPKKVRYTFKYLDMNQIKDHVLKGGREKITMNFTSQETRTIQNKFFKIIIAAWQQDIDIRASLMQIFLKLQKLAANYPMDTSPTLNPLGSLYGSQVIESISIRTSTTELPDSFQNFTLPTIVPLEEGIEAHKNKDYKKAWSCFEENVKINSTVAKYWMGYYLSEGLLGKKDLVKANLLFKEAADDGIADAQLHYAFSLFNTPGIEFDPKVFVPYLTKAANGGNIAAQYNLGDMWFNGKILGIKDIELGTKYFKLAALNNDPRSIKILKENEIDFWFEILFKRCKVM
ncbi:9908_t:CDS:10 [Diversispora eburnea]|uniref:9908_t:CDS:1 n=1 Tax=Diversispora eburnea TaxID=1213867 RepID=A0A9N9AVZ9_9GLOM|nr:9908_t:CDS:10 [Diversispora eburnea]